MNLRHSIQFALGTGLMALSSSAFVYGMEGDLSISKELSQSHIKEVAMVNKFYDGSLNTREGIFHLQAILGECKTEDLPFPYVHKFAGGIYTREMSVPKGCLIVGKIHKDEHPVHLIKGKILVADEYGTKVLEAPMMFTSKKGIKRVGYILEDVVWMDTYRTDATNIEDAEKDIYLDSFEEFDKLSNIIKYNTKIGIS